MYFHTLCCLRRLTAVGGRVCGRKLRRASEQPGLDHPFYRWGNRRCRYPIHLLSAAEAVDISHALRRLIKPRCVQDGEYMGCICQRRAEALVRCCPRLICLQGTCSICSGCSASCVVAAHVNALEHISEVRPLGIEKPRRVRVHRLVICFISLGPVVCNVLGSMGWARALETLQPSGDTQGISYAASCPI